MEIIHVQIDDTTNVCKVTYKGQVHSCRFGDDERMYRVNGDQYLLKAVMVAWQGEPEFDITEEELADLAGGWWQPSDPVTGPEGLPADVPIDPDSLLGDEPYTDEDEFDE